MQEIVIIGAGGFARELFWHIKGAFKVKGFIKVDYNLLDYQNLCGVPVLGNDEWAIQHLDENTAFLIAIGNPDLKAKIGAKYKEGKAKPAIFIHPGAHITGESDLSPGCIICPGVAMTTQIFVGKHVIINLNCTIGHDCHIGEYTTLHPGVHLSGGVKIGLGVEIGTGAVVLPGLIIGDHVKIGAGAVVTHNIPPNETWAGVPARKIN